MPGWGGGAALKAEPTGVLARGCERDDPLEMVA